MGVAAEQKFRWGKLKAILDLARLTGPLQRVNKGTIEANTSMASKRYRETSVPQLRVKQPGMEVHKWPMSCQQLCFQNGPMSSQDYSVPYFGKLSSNNSRDPQALQPSLQRTLIIFDWDDTLLHHAEAHDGTPPQWSRKLANTAKRLLQCAQLMGQTVIVTNSCEGWVELSAELYLPEVVPILQHVTVISARSRWESTLPCSQWKVKAFTELLAQSPPQSATNFISIGDSNLERDAARIIDSKIPNATVKTVKLLEMPSPGELLWQQELVLQKLPEIVCSSERMEIYLQREQDRTMRDETSNPVHEIFPL